MTHMEVDGTADPQLVDIMLKIISYTKAISLLKAEGYEARLMMVAAGCGRHRQDQCQPKICQRTYLSVAFEGFVVAIDAHLQVQ